jgi:hypothetical protein
MKNKGFILNCILLVFEVIGLTWSMIYTNSLVSFKFYTNLSNVLALFSSIFFIITTFVNNNCLSKISKYLKFVSTIGLLITFVVVLFVLGPSGASKNGIEGYMNYIYPHGLLFLHVLCPIVSIISFILFENHKDLDDIRWYLLAALYTFVYGIIVITIVYFTDIKSPYFFTDSKSMGYLKTFIFGLLFVLSSSIFAFSLVKLNKKFYIES